MTKDCAKIMLQSWRIATECLPESLERVFVHLDLFLPANKCGGVADVRHQPLQHAFVQRAPQGGWALC